MAAATLLLPNQTTVVELCVLNKFHFEVEMPTLFVALHSSDNPESKFIRNLESEFAVDEAEVGGFTVNFEVPLPLKLHFFIS